MIGSENGEGGELSLRRVPQTDRVGDSRGQSRLAIGLLGFSLLLALLEIRIHLPRSVRVIVVFLAILAFVSGFLLAAWER
jgi:hypothetical protein